ncbi:ABC transporter permease [Shumkonia mesophila]|uniref:ABC transporter permease n=1 Tax=Shumkonia mesophila TaxID=2838854 RepID=UPI002934F610|nr:ABC transporter permease [Shumkonia mesophila]
MARFLLHRLWQSLLVLAVMSFVIYGLMGLMPGDPIDLMISSNPHVTSEDAARLRSLYGLDKPIVERYGNWLQAALAGDLGYSRTYARPVPEVLAPALVNTLWLLGSTLVLSILIALPAGILAAARPYSRFDYTVNLLAFAGISVPVFWLGLLLIMVFAVMLGALPAGGTGAIGDAGLWERLRYLILPVATLTLASVGGHTRYVRAAMIEVLRQDYIRMARAKGVGRLRVLFRHALRNAMIPVVTVLALDLGFLFSGALVTETIFAYPGMGKMIFDAIMGNDFNLALVALLFATLLTLAGNLLADLAYAWLDPRISYR